MRIFHTDCFTLPLPAGHRFPMAKYAALRARVEAAASDLMSIPTAATDAQLALAHDADYVRRVVDGTLDPRAMRRIGFPWSAALVERSRRSVGATIAACRVALDVRARTGEASCAISLAGGTHHAFRDRGEGYCVFNDAGVAARAMQHEGRVRRVVVIDLDVHQGNGTASIVADDPSVFTFSMHGANNFPFRKETSDWDIALPDGTDDRTYLATLADALPKVLSRSSPGLAIYLAGADPYRGDRLGRLALSKRGLAERDAMVLDRCREARVPVAVVMAGGYAERVEDIVDIHFRTVATALARFAGRCVLD